MTEQKDYENDKDIEYDKKILQTIPYDSYPENVNNAIKLVSYSHNNALPFGSFIYKAQPFPGDIDVIERVEECCSEKDAIKKIKKHFQQIIRNIKKHKNIIISEIKLGLEKWFFSIALRSFLIGEKGQDNFKKFKPKLLKQDLFESLKKGYISKEIFDEFEKILHKTLTKEKITLSDYYNLKNMIRELYILRWTGDEILRGVKYVPKDHITFESALKDPTLFKLDILVPINGKYVEVTNLYELFYFDKNGNKHTLAQIARRTKDIKGKILTEQEQRRFMIIDLKFEIEKYACEYFLKPFKMAKRMFSVARSMKYIPEAKNLIKLFHSDLGKINQIMSELETLKLVLQRAKKPDMKFIVNQLNTYKRP